MALFTLYAQLWLRDYRSQPGSQWDWATPRPSVASVSRYVHERFADPEDLDPSEVSAVYGLSSPTQKG